MIAIAGIHLDGVEFSTIGGLILVASNPEMLLGVIIKAGNSFPGLASVFTPKKALGEVPAYQTSGSSA